jgi:glycosyltransferase involved in cell wall biosynthesis
MQVLYFHQYFSTRQGSTGTRSYEMAKQLIAQGHAVTMVCASYGVANTGLTGPFKRSRREGYVEGIRVIEFELPCSNKDSLLRRSWTFAKYAVRSSLTAVSEKSDVVFATSTPLTAAIPGLFAHYLRWKPFVFEVRDLWPELPKAMGVIKNPLVLGGMAWLERRAYRASRHCIGLAPGIAEGIAKHIPADHISMIPNGCDVDFLGLDACNPWRPEGIAATDCLAIFSGTHGPANGLQAVVDAAKVLHDRGRMDIKLLLIGDGKQKPALQDQAQRLGLTNVVFHESVSKNRLAGLLKDADIGMQILANVPAFYYGTSPNKFFDYLASGLPVLCNYPGWVAGLIKQHQCGIAIPAENATVFADALQSFADQPAERQAMGKRARELAISDFDRSDLSQRFVKVLEQAAEKR